LQAAKAEASEEKILKINKIMLKNLYYRILQGLLRKEGFTASQLQLYQPKYLTFKVNL
jgi:hypothetical protein